MATRPRTVPARHPIRCRPTVRQRPIRRPQRGCAPRHRTRPVHRRHRGLPGQAHAAFVRAPRGAGRYRLRSILAAAAKMPGVLAVITGEELVAARASAPSLPLAIFPGRDGKPMFQARMPVLAADRVRYVGERSPSLSPRRWQQAQDAAEAVNGRVSAAPGRHRRRARDGAGRTADVGRRPRQHRARLGGRRRRSRRCGVRPRCACRARAAARHAAGAERHGAARRPRDLRRPSRSATP